MELKIIREKSNKEYTEGKLYINGVFFCDTLEDFWVDPLYNYKSAEMGFIHLGKAKPAYQATLNNDLQKENPELWNECVKQLEKYNIKIKK